MTMVLVVPSFPPSGPAKLINFVGDSLDGWRECDGVVERVRNNKISAPPPIGYSSTGEELRPQQERSKFPSGGGVSARTGWSFIWLTAFALFSPYSCLCPPTKFINFAGPRVGMTIGMRHSAQPLLPRFRGQATE